MSWADKIRNSQTNTDQPLNPMGSTVPKPVEPTVDTGYAKVNPYRGIETHGVPVTASVVAEGDVEVDPGTYTPPAADIEPIPVKVINQSTDEIAAWTASQLPVGNNVAQLIGRDRARKRVTIAHGGSVSDPVVLGHSVNLSMSSGFVLSQGQTITINTTEPVYAMTNASSIVNLMVMQERTVNPLDQNVGLSRE